LHTQKPLAKHVDPLAAGFAASKVIAHPRQILSIQPVLEHHTG
jgi:hypothetical protein